MEKYGTLLIGKSAVGRTVSSEFKNSITTTESQHAVRIFVSGLLEMIERLDGGPATIGPLAQFVLRFQIILVHSKLLITFFSLLFFFFLFFPNEYTYIMQISKI